MSPLEKSAKMVWKWKPLAMLCQTVCIWKIESVATWIEHSCIVHLSCFWLSCFDSLVVLLTNDLPFHFVRTCWRLFQKRVQYTKLISTFLLHIFVYLWGFNIDISTIIFTRSATIKQRWQSVIIDFKESREIIKHESVTFNSFQYKMLSAII